MASQQSDPLEPGLTLLFLRAVGTLTTFGPAIASCTSQNSSALAMEKQCMGTMDRAVARHMRRHLVHITDVVSAIIA